MIGAPILIVCRTYFVTMPIDSNLIMGCGMWKVYWSCMGLLVTSLLTLILYISSIYIVYSIDYWFVDRRYFPFSLSNATICFKYWPTAIVDVGFLNGDYLLTKLRSCDAYAWLRVSKDVAFSVKSTRTVASLIIELLLPRLSGGTCLRAHK